MQEDILIFMSVILQIAKVDNTDVVCLSLNSLRIVAAGRFKFATAQHEYFILIFASYKHSPVGIDNLSRVTRAQLDTRRFTTQWHYAKETNARFYGSKNT